MAAQILQPGAAPANALSRRGVIAALTVAPAFAATASHAAEQGAEAMNMHTSHVQFTTSSFSSEWSRLVSAYRAARAHQDRVQPIFNRAELEYFARLPEEPIVPPHHPLPLSTTLGEVIGRPLGQQWSEYAEAKEAWRAECKRIREATLAKAEAAWESAISATYDAAIAIEDFPAPSTACLREKMSVLETEFGKDLAEGTHVEGILADVRRLLTH